MSMILIQLIMYLALCLSTSSLGQALYHFTLIDTTDYFEYCLVIIVSLAVFITCTVLLLCKHYEKIDNRNKFFKLSYAAYGIFALISIACFFTMGDDVLYATLFNTLKLMKFSLRGINTLTSVVLTHCFMLVLIAFMPILAEVISHSPKRKKNENRISMGLRITDDKNGIKSVRGDGKPVTASSDANNGTDEQKKSHSHHGHSSRHGSYSSRSSHSRSGHSHSGRSGSHSGHSSGSHSHHHSSRSGHHSHHSSSRHSRNGW